MVLCVNLTVYADGGQPTQKEQLAFEKINRVMNKLGYESIEWSPELKQLAQTSVPEAAAANDKNWEEYISYLGIGGRTPTPEQYEGYPNWIIANNKDTRAPEGFFYDYTRLKLVSNDLRIIGGKVGGLDNFIGNDYNLSEIDRYNWNHKIEWLRGASKIGIYIIGDDASNRDYEYYWAVEYEDSLRWNPKNKIYYGNGKEIVDQWVYVRGNWLYIYKDNFGNRLLKEGWFQDGGNWYYLEPEMVKNRWISEGTMQYYFGADGVMLTNTITPDGFRVDEQGRKLAENIPDTSEFAAPGERELVLFNQINSIRVENGLKPMEWDGRLTAALNEVKTMSSANYSDATGEIGSIDDIVAKDGIYSSFNGGWGAYYAEKFLLDKYGVLTEKSGFSNIFTEQDTVEGYGGYSSITLEELHKNKYYRFAGGFIFDSNFNGSYLKKSNSSSKEAGVPKIGILYNEGNPYQWRPEMMQKGYMLIVCE